MITLKEVLELAEDNPKGFSAWVNTGGPVAGNWYMCAFKMTQNCFGETGAAIALASIPNGAELYPRAFMAIGGWKDGDKYYFDLTCAFDNLERALAFGREQEQIAVWDVANKKLHYCVAHQDVLMKLRDPWPKYIESEIAWMHDLFGQKWYENVVLDRGSTAVAAFMAIFERSMKMNHPDVVTKRYAEILVSALYYDNKWPGTYPDLSKWSSEGDSPYMLVAETDSGMQLVYTPGKQAVTLWTSLTAIVSNKNLPRPISSFIRVYATEADALGDEGATELLKEYAAFFGDTVTHEKTYALSLSAIDKSLRRF